MHVEIHDRNSPEAMGAARLMGAHGDIVEQAKPHGRRRLGMVARRANGAEGIGGLARGNRIDGGRDRACRPQRRLAGAGRERGIAIQHHPTRSGHRFQQRLDEAAGMGAGDLVDRRPRRLMPFESGEGRRLERRQNRLEPGRSFRMARSHVMFQASGMGIEPGRHNRHFRHPIGKCHRIAEWIVEPVDFIVIGAGIAGASAAYALAEHGRVLVAGAREPARLSHHRPLGGAVHRELRQPDDPAPDPGQRPLSEAAAGGLRRASDPDAPRRADDRASRSAWHPRRAEAGSAHLGAPVEHLDAAGTLALLPLLRPGYAAAALYEPDALDIDVHGLHRGFLRAASARGGRLLCDAEVGRIGRRDGNWQLETKAGAFEAPVVVNAAGAWADEIAVLAGVRPVGLQPKRRTAFTFDGPPGLGEAVLPMCIDVAETFYFKPEAGRFLGSLADETPSPPCDAQPRGDRPGHGGGADRGGDDLRYPPPHPSLGRVAQLRRR
jgi:Glycine/D-amino acid oxidases (deaminating)